MNNRIEYLMDNITWWQQQHEACYNEDFDPGRFASEWLCEPTVFGCSEVCEQTLESRMWELAKELDCTFEEANQYWFDNK